MNKYIRPILTVALLLVVSFVKANMLIQVNDSTHKKVEFEKKFNVLPTHTIEINLSTRTSLSIEGWDRNEVVAIVKMEGAGLIVECKQLNDKVYISSSFQTVTTTIPSKGSIQIKVPKKMATRAVISEGDTRLDFLENEIFIETTKGNIISENVSGKINFSSQDGFIDLTGGKAEGIVTAMHSSISLHKVSGKLSVSGLSGHFSIDSPNQLVDATIISQAIELFMKEGKLQATIYKGNLDINWLGTHLSKQNQLILNAHEGEINLKLPTGFGMETSIEQISSQESESGMVSSIESDFDLGTFPAGNEFTHQGKKKTLMQFNKAVAGGGNLVEIHVVDSKVRFKKI